MSCIFLKNPRIRGRFWLGEMRKRPQETFLVDLERTIFTCNLDNSSHTHFLRGIILPGNPISFDVRKCCLDSHFRASEYEVLIQDLPAKQQDVIYSSIDEEAMFKVWRRLVEPLLYRGESAYGYTNHDEFAVARRAEAYEAYLNSTAPLMLYEKLSESLYLFRFPILVQPKAIIAYSHGNICSTCGKLKVCHEEDFNYSSYEDLVAAKIGKIIA